MHLLRDVARWTFVVALFYAPWAYGGTTATSIETINWLLLAALAVWIVELVINRRAPKFPRALIVLVFGLLAIGGWMVFNASAICDSGFDTFAPLRKIFSHLTGSVDYAISAAWMVRGALLLGVILFVVDLSRDNQWLLQLWCAIGIVAGSLAFLGLLQKATGASMIFWQPAPPGGVNTFFATYYYHANAGAFLNLVWPLTAGLAVRSFVKPSSAGMRAVWLSIFVLTFAAVFANTSRMAQLIALLLFIALGFRLGPGILRRLSRAEKNIALAGAGAILLALFAVGQASHLEQPIKRWENLSENISTDARWLAASVAVRALPDIGFLGFGPGTFRVAFPLYNELSAAPAAGFWRFLHEDYLQTALEWGWLGSALWAVVFFGGIMVAVRHCRSPDVRSWTRRRNLLLPLVVIALAGVALHALVDFPLQIASIQLYVATYLGLCWGSAGRRAED
jgi:O-Antigen ligase